MGQIEQEAKKGGGLMIRIDNRSRLPIYEQIVQRVEEMILLGVYQKDDKLPSVRALASELVINPNTIQKAYNLLEQKGIIYSRQGRGSFVAMDAEALHEEQAPQIFESFDQSLNQLVKLNIKKERVQARVDACYAKAEKEVGQDD